MIERLNHSSVPVSSLEKQKGNGFSELVESYLKRIYEGEETISIIKQIWKDHYKGETPIGDTRVIIGNLLDNLPKDITEQLEQPIYRTGSVGSLILLAQEEAQKEVNEERRQRNLEEAKRRTSSLEQDGIAEKKEKKPSKGWAKHIRREKAARRRGIK